MGKRTPEQIEAWNTGRSDFDKGRTLGQNPFIDSYTLSADWKDGWLQVQSQKRTLERYEQLVRTFEVKLLDGARVCQWIQAFSPGCEVIWDFPCMHGESKVMLWEQDVAVWPDEYITARKYALVGKKVSIQNALCLMAGDGVINEGTYTVYFSW